jgi:hypothetical protein
MTHITPIQQEYVEIIRGGHWWTRDQVVQWKTGGRGRHKQIERVLPALVKKGALVKAKLGKRAIYATPNRYAQSHYHGYYATEALVRFIVSKPGAVIPEHYFSTGRFGVVPEWGIKYPNNHVLLCEFTTETQYRSLGAVAGKIARYNKSLQELQNRLGCIAFTLFILDVPRWEVEHFVHRSMYLADDAFFVDHASFLSIPYGKQLSAPIYIWGEDGESYPLGHDD